MASLGQFAFKKSINLNTSAGGANVSDNTSGFPIQVHINTNSWPTTGDRDDFFDNAGVSGDRIQFYDSNNATNLDYEIEFFGSSEALYHVEKPVVLGNSTSDNMVMAYGNDPNGSSQDNKTGTWNSGYVGVWHMGDNAFSSSEALDSTVNPSDAINDGTVDVASQMRRGRTFDGGNDDMRVANAAKIDTTGSALTVECWAQFDTTGTPMSLVVMPETEGAGGTHKYTLWRENGVIQFILQTTAGTATSPSAAFSDTVSIHHFCGTYDGTKMKTCIDGVPGTTVAQTGGIVPSSNTALKFGEFSDNFPLRFDGNMDEPRVSTVARSSNYIQLTYIAGKKTNFNGDDWISWSTQQATSATGVVVLIAERGPFRGINRGIARGI